MNTENDFLVAVIGFVVFFGMFFGVMAYCETAKADCRTAAIQKGMTAIEIQGVCK
jgi:hypothetical protein